MNEAKRRRDLLAKAQQPTGEAATSAAAERDAKRRRELQANANPAGAAPRAVAERDAKRRREVLAKTKPNREG